MDTYAHLWLGHPWAPVAWTTMAWTPLGHLWLGHLWRGRRLDTYGLNTNVSGTYALEIACTPVVLKPMARTPTACRSILWGVHALGTFDNQL